MTDQSSGDDATSAPPPGWQPPAGSSPGYLGGTTPPPPPGAQPNPGPPPGSAQPPYPSQAHPSQPYPTQPYPSQPYPSGPASYAGPPQGTWSPPGLRAAHKPGAMALRPLGLGDIYDAAFRIIRFNPRATVGSAVLVAAVSMTIPIVVTAILTATVDLSLTSLSSTGGDGFDQSSIVGLIGSFGSLGVGSVLAYFGAILVTGMIAHVAAAAAVGRKLTLGQAWAATHGKRWRLVGLSLLGGLVGLVLIVVYAAAWVALVLLSKQSVVAIVIWGLVTVPLFFALLIWLSVRAYYLAVPALMLEDVGILGSVRRAFALTRRQFWRTFGILILTTLVVGIAGQIIGFPVGLIGQVASVAVPDRYTVLALVVTQSITQVVTLAFTTPFTSAVTSLQYLDQRMRKEAYDVELMQQAGITA